MIVYRVTNQINDKIYIGQTIRSLSDRWSQHIVDRNKFDYPLYRAIRKYGKDNFICEVLETANSIEELNKKEHTAILNFNSMNKNVGYNILPGGKNYKLPLEVKNKISKSMKGKKFNSHIDKDVKSKIARSNALKNSVPNFEVYNKEGILLYSGRVLSDCAKQLKTSPSTIFKWVRGMRTSKKYHVLVKKEN